jgi:hypothetical protein
MGLTEVARHRRCGGAAAARRVSSGDDASLRPMVMWLGSWGPEREREHDEVRPFWLREGEEWSSLKRWGGGGFSVISGQGWWNPTSGSRHLATEERGGGVGCFGVARLARRKEISERGVWRLLHRSGGENRGGVRARPREGGRRTGGGGSLGALRGEKDGGGGVRSSGRARGRRERATVCPAWQRGSRGIGGSG